MKITREELRSIIEEALASEGFSHSGPDPAHALSTSEIMRMVKDGIDVTGMDRTAPFIEKYLDANQAPTKLTVGDRSEIYDSPDETDDEMALGSMGDTPYAIDDSGDLMDRGIDIRAKAEELLQALRGTPTDKEDDRLALADLVQGLLDKMPHEGS